MKRLVLFFFVATFCWVGESAAQRFPHDVLFGLRGGLSVANLRGDDIGDLDWRTGVVLGGFARAPVTPVLALQPEVLFVQKGAVRHQGDVDVVLRGSYVQIPVLFVYDVMIDGPAQPYVAAGPALGLRVDESLVFRLDGDDETLSGDEVDLFDRTDFGLVFGAGVGFDVGYGVDLIADARFDLGLVDIAAENFGADASARTSTIELSLGVMLREW